MYEIIQDFIHFNNPNKILVPQGVTLHSTATPGATDEDEQDFFDKGNQNASAHAFIDWDSITQTIDWYKRAWHGGPIANSKFIGIELCEPSGYDPIKFNEVWKRAVWLFAYLFINVIKTTTVTKDNLMSHAEVSQRYKDTDHQDPVAFFAKYGKTVDMFRKEVQEAINAMAQKKWQELISEASQQPNDWIKGINAIIAATNNANLGDINILKFLPDLIEKIGNK